MQRLAVIVNLRPDSESRAAELIEQGPPFNPKEIGFERHSVFLGGEQAVFVFEGGKLDDLLRNLVADPTGAGALRRWEDVIEGMPRIARDVYSWERGEEWPETWGE